MAKTMKLIPDQIAVIGNNRISDIWGANRANMYSIYIQNLNSHRFKKKVEDRLKDLGIKKIKQKIKSSTFFFHYLVLILLFYPYLNQKFFWVL